MCCEPYDLTDDGSKINGQCPECGEDTVDGSAAIGCCYSPVICKICGSSPCDGSC